MTRLFLGLPAPAKLNLFLHVVGRRADGYHELQSAVVPISLADTLDFELRTDGVIERTGDVIGPLDDDLVQRAALLLKAESAYPLGASIYVEKRVPAGSGLGGGSSDAATTLLALNRLWNLHWSRERLASLAVRLGADVPFFLSQGPAFVQGIGEQIVPLEINLKSASLWAVVVYPQVHVSTMEIFNSSGLTRDSKPVTIRALREELSCVEQPLFGANDLQAEVARKVPQVQVALDVLNRLTGTPGAARMSGSGSAVFTVVDDEGTARRVADSVSRESGFDVWAVRLLSEHPLSEW